MKIDFAALRALVASGVTAAAIVDYLEEKERERAPKREKKTADRRRQRATSGDKRRQLATCGDNERQTATLSDTPRARLFREGKPALLTLKISDSRAGALITEWLKLTRDDDQLVLAAILRARDLAVVDAPSWILATLRGKVNGPRGSAVSNAIDGLIADAEGRECPDDFGDPDYGDICAQGR